ncbi:Ig-like domain-containing protein [Nocardioides rubriscoriae]|uniref:Ig-like domain-containing protein n=1 Tax=Nocardioides rubriscoriae TaxID=642762 RepID=UPI0024823833|nr:Ig-like domain-containing protein [Nocardioides rubriscoriae]
MTLPTRPRRSLLAATLATTLVVAALAVVPQSPAAAVVPPTALTPARALPVTGPVGAAEIELDQQALAGGVDGAATAYHPPSGRFLTLWTGTRQASPAGTLGLKQEVLGRWVDATTGQPDGAPFVVASQGDPTDGTLDAVDPSLAWDPAAGAFVIAWAGDTEADAPAASFDHTTFGVFVRTYVPGGPLSTPVQLDTAPAGTDARHPDVDVRGAAGRVVWEHTTDGGGAEIRTSRLSAGLPVGPVAALGASTSSDDGAPAVALRDDGRALVVWTGDSTVPGGTPLRTYAVAVDDAGGAGPVVLAGETSSSPAYEETDADVAAVGDTGAWRVAWSANTAAAPDAFRVRAETLTLTGTDLGSIAPDGAVQTVGDQPGDDLAPSVAVNGDGDTVVAWVVRNGADHQVWGARVTPTGAVLDAARLSASRAAAPNTQPTRPAVAWSTATRGTSSVAWAGDAAWSRLLSGPNVVSADLGVGLAFDPSAPSAPVAGVEPGTAATYTVDYTSVAGAARTAVDDVTITLPLPASVVGDGAPTYPTTPTGTTVTVAGTDTLTFTVSHLEPGATGSIVVPVRLAAGVASGTTSSATATVAATGNTDLAPGNDQATATFTTDDKPYVAAVAAPAGPVGSSAVFTVTLSEAVTGLAADDLDVATTGSVSAQVTSVELVGAQADVTVTSTGDGTLRLVVPATATATDGAGKPLSTGNLPVQSAEVAVDTTRPTVALSAPAGPVDGPFEVTATFSEPVTDLALADVAVTNGTASALAGSAMTYTVTVTPASDGDVTVEVPEGAALDAAGNTSTAAVPLTRTFDGNRPALTLGAAAGPFDAPFRATLDFSEPVSGVALDDVVVGNGTASDLQGTGASYSVLVSPTGEGDVTVDVPEGAATDAVGNPSTAAVTLTRRYDTTAPVLTVAVAPGQADPVRGREVRFTVTADEPVDDLDAAEVTLSQTSADTGATDVATRRTGPATFEVVVTGMARAGDVTVAVVDGAVSDTAGNPSGPTASATAAWVPTAPPSIGLLFDRGCVGAAGTIGLSLTPVVPTTLRLVTGNPRLLPLSRVRVTRSGADDERASLTVEPVAGLSGVARLTVLATNLSGTRRRVVRVVVGTARADRVRGTTLAEVVLARGGADRVVGAGEGDLLCGEAGDDRLEGGAGDDALYGGTGADTLVGGPGRDRLVGGPGRDRLVGAPGDVLVPRELRGLRSAPAW